MIEPSALNATEVLEQKLQAMPWTLSTVEHRCPSLKQFTRRSGRYCVVQDHGTAEGRKGIEQRREQRAEKHHNSWYWRDTRRMNAARKRLFN